MDNEELPTFRLVSKALASGKPFLLHFACRIKLQEIPEDKWPMIHDALLQQSFIAWKIHTTQDLRFIATVIRQSRKLVKLELESTTSEDVKDDDMADLVSSLQSSHIQRVGLNRNGNSILLDFGPILRGLRTLESLQKLKIVFSPVEPDEFEALAQALQNPHLKKFSDLGDDQSHVWPFLVPVLSSHPSIVFLEIFREAPGAYQALGEILSANTAIQILALGNYAFYSHGVEQFHEALKKNNTLKKLYLSEPDKLEDFFRLLACDQTKILDLKVDSEEMTEQHTCILSESLKTNTVLQKLTIGPCEVDPGKVLCEGLRNNSTLKSLSLRHYISTESIHALCEYLKQNKSLEELDLGWSKEEECKLLADMLLVNTTLKKLIMYNSKFLDDGIISLCGALKKNTTLRHLEADANHFSVKGLTGVKEMLALNTTLRVLCVNCDCNSEESIDVLCEGLKLNTTLTCIQIGGRQWRSDTSLLETKVAQVFEYNYSLDEIKLSRPLSREISTKLERNRRLKSEAKFTVAMLSHNIARSKETLESLPRELWISILSSVTHPGMDSFNTLVENIFASAL